MLLEVLALGVLVRGAGAVLLEVPALGDDVVPAGVAVAPQALRDMTAIAAAVTRKGLIGEPSSRGGPTTAVTT